MKKLALLLLALAVSGAVFAGEPSLSTGFSLAIGRAPATSGTPRIPLHPGEGMGFPTNSSAAGAQASVRSSQLAEFHLGRLSRSQKTARMITGGIMVPIGVAGIVLGAGMASLKEEEAWFFADLGKVFGIAFIAAGSALTIGGIYSLAAPSEAERDYRDVMRIEDPEQREKACRLALPELAAHGRRNRIIAGVISSVIGLAALAGSGGEDTASALPAAALFGGLGLYSFLAKSPAEKALRSYELEAGANKTTQLSFGVGPRGRVQATLLISY